MLNDLICKKRDELNKSISDGQDYSVTYKISVELDELIAQFYRDSAQPKKKEKNTNKEKEKNKRKKVIFI